MCAPGETGASSAVTGPPAPCCAMPCTGEAGWRWRARGRPERTGGGGAVAAAADIVRANAREGRMTYVNINNHYEGSAPLTIARFVRELARK